MKTYEVLLKGDVKYIGAVRLEGGMAFIKWKNIFERVWIPRKSRSGLFRFMLIFNDPYDGKWVWQQPKDIENYHNPIIFPISEIVRMIEVTDGKDQE